MLAAKPAMRCECPTEAECRHMDGAATPLYTGAGCGTVWGRGVGWTSIDKGIFSQSLVPFWGVQCR